MTESGPEVASTPLGRDPLGRDPLGRDPLGRDPLGRESIRSLVAMAVTLLVLGVATYQIWSRFTPGAGLRNAPLTAEKIHASKPPQWVKSNIPSEVVVQGSLGDHDLSEPGLVRVVHRAFTNHPWVKKVRYASIESGSEVIVELEYRQPLAAVVVNAAQVQVEEGARSGLVPIDEEGVCLPDVTEAQANTMPRIYAEGAVPPHGYGQKWTDKRVQQSAAIVAALTPLWDNLQLYAVQAPSIASLATRERTSFELRTKQQQRIIWGSPPNEELRGEPAVADKIAYLTRTAPSLNSAASTPTNSPSEIVIDLRVSQGGESSAQRSSTHTRLR